MVAIGTTLRATTVMFLSIAVGITFDNTIHLFSGVREARARGLSHEEAVKETLDQFGPPIIYTSLLIAAGLGIFMVSSIPCLFALGLTSAVVVLLAAISDLLVTSVLIDRWGSRLLAPKKAQQAGPGESESQG
jgi:predicted RND superfamily exporter protein